ncbi:MAG TPA: methylated-DNA--[protein]-cysteine S-methyltransferase [Acidimicrobiales bacterium]|nr:methylated-DNA--[protein]-cysteine S-methyltransferase [Acidimicrobiales bacterium]
MSDVQSTTVDSPIGTLVLEADDDVLLAIRLPGSRPRPPGAARRVTSRTGTRRTSTALSATRRQLEEYFAGRRRRFDIPLSVSGTDFQCDVWRSLAEIPYGAVVSYAELAEMVGRPTAFRAVGQANGANPIPIVLPCHRVVATGGRIGGYGGGLPMKRRLLALEGVTGL